MYRLDTPQHATRSIVVSYDGTRLASASDIRVQVWDPIRGKVISELCGHEDVVESIALFADGTTVASGSWDRSIRIWDVDFGTQILPAFARHTAPISSVAFSPDSSELVSGGHDSSIRVWDANDGAEIFVVGMPDSGIVLSAVYSPDGQKIVCATEWEIQLLDAHAGGAVVKFNCAYADFSHLTTGKLISFSPDGTRFALCPMGTFRVWDVDTGALLPSSTEDILGRSTSVAMTWDHWLVHLSSQRTFSKIPSTFRISRLVGSGHFVAVGTTSGKLLIIHIPANTLSSSETRVAEN